MSRSFAAMWSGSASCTSGAGTTRPPSTRWSGAHPRTSTLRSISRRVSRSWLPRSPSLDWIHCRRGGGGRRCRTCRCRGDPFNRYAMQASADSITRRLRDHGYPSATVFTGFEVDKPERRASVSLDVAPGRRAVIGRIKVVGAVRVDSSLVRKLLVARPGRRGTRRKSCFRASETSTSRISSDLPRSTSTRRRSSRMPTRCPSWCR